MLKVNNDFNALFEKWFNMLMENENFNIRLDEEFSPLIQQNGHDIDYLYWFLGYPKKIVALGGKRTPLEGDAEDLIKGVLEFAGGVTASLHLDYWQRPPRRVFELVGSEGNLIWDYYAKTLTLLFQDPKKQTKTIDLPIDFDRNNMFIDEMKDFIDSIKNGSNPAVTLQDGINVLQIALELKREINF